MDTLIDILTAEEVLAGLSAEARDAKSETVRVSALRALADYYGLIRGEGKGDPESLPELPITVAGTEGAS